MMGVSIEGLDPLVVQYVVDAAVELVRRRRDTMTTRRSLHEGEAALASAVESLKKARPA